MVEGMEAVIAEQMKALVMEEDIGIVDVHLEEMWGSKLRIGA